MTGNENPRPPQSLGQRGSEVWMGPVRLFVAPKEWPPFLPDAFVEEEDTYLVLSADPEVQETRQEPGELMAELLKTKPKVPGSVVVKGGQPLSLMAIVHDLSRDPSWREDWVVSALDRILREAQRRKLRSLALPLLATLHGSLDRQRFLALLQEALERNSPEHLVRLWLVVPAGTAREVLGMLISPPLFLPPQR